MTEIRLLENARCWGLMGRCTDMGIPLSTGIPIAEQACRDDELRPLFGEAISLMEHELKIPPNWQALVVPYSTRELIQVGWLCGMLNLTLGNAQHLLEAKVAYLRRPQDKEDRQYRESLFFFYLKTLVESGLTLPRSLEIARDELALPDSGPVIDSMIAALMAGGSMVPAMKAAGDFFLPESIETFAAAEADGDFSALSRIADKRRHDQGFKKNDERAIFYERVATAMDDPEKGLLTAIDEGLASLPDSDFRRNWVKINKAFEAGTPENEIFADCGLTLLEVSVVQTALMTGMLPQLFRSLARELNAA